MPFPFVNPWMLAGLSAVAIPLLIRLFARREYVSVPWGAMQFLAAASEHRARLPRTEWLLLALRMGALALLALAFARPWLENSPFVPLGMNALRDVVVVIDGSASMSAKAGDTDDEKTFHQRALRSAGTIIDELTRGDSITLIDARDEPQVVFAPVTHEFTAIRESLDRIPPPHGPANLVRAATRAVSLLEQGDNLAQEIIVLTDGQSAAWPASDSPQWSIFNDLCSVARVSPRVRVLDVSARSRESSSSENFAVGPLWTTRSFTAVGLPIRIGAAIHARGDEKSRNVAAHIEIDGKRVAEKSRQIRLEPDGDNDVEFAHHFDTPGIHTVAIALDPDGRPADDRAEIAIQVLSPIAVLLVDGATSNEPGRGETFFAAQALGNETPSTPWLKTSVVHWDQWQPVETPLPSVVVLANVPRVTDSQAKWLEQHVANGGGLLIAPGNRTDRDTYNQLLFRAGEGVLPAAMKQIRRVEGAHPFETIDAATLAPYWSNTFGDTSDPQFMQTSSWWLLDDISRGAADARLRPSGDPLLISRHHGHGRVLQMSIPLNAEWSDLPTRQSFVPLLHEMLLWLAASDVRDSSPEANSYLSPASRQRAENIRAEATVEPLDPAAREELTKRGDLEFFVSPDDLIEHQLHAAQPVEFWRWLLLGSVLLLVAEAYLTARIARTRQLSPTLGGASAASHHQSLSVRGAIRVAAVVVATALLFEPVFRWTAENVAVGRVIVAIDASGSMEARDSRSSSDALFSNDAELPANRAEATMDVIHHALSIGEMTFPSSVTPEYLLFGGDVESVDPRLFADSSRKLLGKTADPQPTARPRSLSEFRPPDRVLADSTDLAALLNRLAAQSSGVESSADAPLAVVLFTDGMDTEQRDVTLAAERLAGHSTRIIPVIVGSDVKAPNLAVRSVEVPRIVFAGEQARITAHLMTDGFEGKPVHVVVHAGDTPTGNSTIEQSFQPTGRESTVNVDIPVGTAGLQSYNLHVAATGSDESNDDNQTLSFCLRVVEDKARVMMLEGEARWEFRALDGTLGRDEHIDWKPVVFRQPYLGLLPDTFFPRRLDLTPGTATSADSPFAQCDLVIIGDIGRDDVSTQGWNLLEGFVAEQGGTLLFLSGKQNFPQRFESPVVRQLLPVSQIHSIPLDAMTGEAKQVVAREFHVQPTAAAEEYPAFRLDGDPAKNRAIWSELPGHSWGLTGVPKPGATVLANAILEKRSEPKIPDGTVAESPVVVTQRYGLGEVIWLGFDSTWRWRRRDDQKHHHHFWSSLARAAARNRTAFGTGELRFGAVDADVTVGDEVALRAQLSPMLLQRIGSSPLRAEIRRTDDGRVVRVWDLANVDDKPHVREARGRSLPVGSYRIQLVAESADVQLPEVTASLHVRSFRSRERLNRRPDEELLRRIAAIGHGEVLRPDQLDRLSTLIPAPLAYNFQLRAIRLWNHPVTLLLIVFLLTLEWGLRQREGLP